MRWYALKLRPMLRISSEVKGEKVADGHVVNDSFTATYSPAEYEQEPIFTFNPLLVCEEDTAPKYDNDTGKPKHT